MQRHRDNGYRTAEPLLPFLGGDRGGLAGRKNVRKDENLWKRVKKLLTGIGLLMVKDLATYFRVPVTRIIDDVAYLCEGVAVGTPVAQRPPRGTVRALISAHGSYRGYLASKRTMGYG